MALRWFTGMLFSAISCAANSCDLTNNIAVTTALPSLLDGGTPRKISLSNNSQLAIPEAAGVLKMHSADSFILLDQLTVWPTETGQISSIKAQPVVLDNDYDGVADAVYVLDTSGQLWFVPLTRNGFTGPELIADFSGIAAEFHQPLQLVQTMSADSMGVMRRQTMLLLIGSAADGDTLFMVKHSQSGPVIQLQDLFDRTELGHGEAGTGIADLLWQQIRHGAGWFVRLGKRITVVPQVYAGVVYFGSAQVAAVQSDCSLTAKAELQIHALHLHHAGAVYTRRHWQVAALEHGRLVLQKTPQGELELRLRNEQQQQRVHAGLVAISADCADCVTPLTTEQFPRISWLATFQAELDGH